MKHSCTALFLALCCLAAQSFADDVELAEHEVRALEEQLLTSPLIDAEVEFDDSVSPTEARRFWNPFSWIRNKLKNKCKCEGLKCECCFKIKLFKLSGCLKMEQLMEEKKLSIAFTLGDADIVNKKFDIQRNDKICGSIPKLNFLKFCFNQATDVADDGTINACSSVDLRIGGAVGAVLQFRCIEVKNGDISFGGDKEVEKTAMLAIKVKDPLTAVAALPEKLKEN